MADEQTKDTQHDTEGLMRKNAELLAEVKKLKARIADLEGERDAAQERAEAAQATMRRVQLEEPIEAALGEAFRLPWRIVKPLVEEHFAFELGEDGKPQVTAVATGEAVEMAGLVAEMAAIPDLAAAMRPPSGGGAKGNDGGMRDAATEARAKPEKVASPFGLR